MEADRLFWSDRGGNNLEEINSLHELLVLHQARQVPLFLVCPCALFGYFCFIFYFFGTLHCPKNNLNPRMKTEPVTAGEDAMRLILNSEPVCAYIYRSQTYTVASAPSVTELGFLQTVWDVLLTPNYYINFNDINGIIV